MATLAEALWPNATPQAEKPPAQLSRDEKAPPPKPGEGSGTDQPKPGAAAAPELVDVEGLKVPKGYDVKDPVLSDFRKAAGELGVDAGGAQRLFDLHHRALTAQQTALDAQVAGWGKATREDKEIGGAALDGSLRSAQAVLKEFGTPELRDVLNGGIGDHPELIRVFARIGAALKKSRAGSSVSLAEQLYGGKE